MLEREALRWERQHLDGRYGGEGSSSGAGQPEKAGEGAKVPPLRLRRDEFPLGAFLKTGTGSGGEGHEQRREDSDLPELVREELLHRFVMGKLQHNRVLMW